jgi:hypothetical protein
MEKIVDIRERIEGRKKEELLEQFRVKIETIQKIAQCSACLYRCAMCGQHVRATDTDTAEQSELSSRGIALCPTCREEFEAYLSLSRGEKRPGLFWQNEAWMNMWEAWLGYRQALMDFIHSPEFRDILEELDR